MSRKKREQLLYSKSLMQGKLLRLLQPSCWEYLLGGSGRSSSDIVFLEIRGLFIRDSPDREKITQFECIMNELHSNVYHASSPLVGIPELFTLL
jgi:hypothetical protein